MANRYWVGGTAAWDGTAGTKWALTSGGAGGQAVPTSADDVFFDASSGANTVTISAGNTGAKSITCTGFTGTLAGSAAISVSGSVTLATGMTLTYTGIITFIATGTLTSAGKTLSSIFIDGVGITVSLGDAYTSVSGASIGLTNGTFNLNGFTATPSRFTSSNLNTRAVTFGSANIVLAMTIAGQTVLSMASATNFTWTGTGGFVRNMAATATMEFGSTQGATTSNAPNMTVNAGASALTITSGSYFKNLVFTGSTSTVTASSVNMAGNLTLATGGTYTAVAPTFRASGTLTNSGKTLSALTVNGSGITVTCADALTTSGALTLTDGTLKLKDGVTSTVDSFVTTGTTLKYLESASAGTQATISDTTGTNTVTYLSIKDSNATGGAVFDATSATNVNGGNNTGWTGLSSSGNGKFFAFFM